MASSVREVTVAAYVDANYLVPLCVMIRSAMANLDAAWRLRVYVIHCAREPLDVGAAAGLLGQNARLAVEWLGFDSRDFDREFEATRGFISKAAFYRILVGSILPPGIERVILLDSDIVVTGDLSPLMTVDFGAGLALAVPDAVVPVVALADGGGLAAEGLAAGAPYFNSGVIVVALPRWIEQKVERRALDFIRRRRGSFLYGDQCALNAALAGCWRRLGPEWNLQTELCTFDFNSPLLFPRRALRAARKAPRIVHFSGSSKPWQRGCTHPLRHVYIRYAPSTPVIPATKPTFRTMLARVARQHYGLKSALHRAIVFRRLGLPFWGELREAALYAARLTLREPWFYPLSLVSVVAVRIRRRSPKPERQLKVCR